MFYKISFKWVISWQIRHWFIPNPAHSMWAWKVWGLVFSLSSFCFLSVNCGLLSFGFSTFLSTFYSQKTLTFLVSCSHAVLTVFVYFHRTFREWAHAACNCLSLGRQSSLLRAPESTLPNQFPCLLWASTSTFVVVSRSLWPWKYCFLTWIAFYFSELYRYLFSFCLLGGK